MGSPSAEKKWALILGATSGSGAAIARALSDKPGMNIVGIHRGHYQESARQIQAEVEGKGLRCEMWLGDAAKIEQIEVLAGRLQEVCGAEGVKFFVHSIADGTFGRFVSGEKDQFHPKQVLKTFDAMAHSFVYWAKELVSRNLLAPRSNLLGLTNVIVDSAVNGLGLISAAKMALETYIRYLAIELGPKGHRVNLLKFGLADTPAIRMAFSPEAFADLVRKFGRITPARRIISSEEVAKFVSVLVSEELDWFNGATIDYSGGQAQSVLDVIANSPKELHVRPPVKGEGKDLRSEPSYPASPAGPPPK